MGRKFFFHFVGPLDPTPINLWPTYGLLTSKYAWVCARTILRYTQRNPRACVYACTHIYLYMDTHTSTYTNVDVHTGTHTPSSPAQGEAAWLWSHKTEQKGVGGQTTQQWPTMCEEEGENLLEAQLDSQFSRREVGEGRKDLRQECTEEVRATVGPHWLPHRANPDRLQMIKNELIWLENFQFGCNAGFTNKWEQIA